MSQNSTDSKFRVIVIGAGVAGLTASHCLQKAGIDHVVLERRTEIDPPEGASIAIYPHGARILHQIGCLEACKAACTPCQNWLSRSPDGKIMSNNGFFKYVKENHGQDILLFERRNFLRILYDGLLDKTRIRTGCQISGIEQTQNGIEVILADGTKEEGDVVLGCDGVYSLARNVMWDMGNVPAHDKTAMKTAWRCLVGTGPLLPGLGQSDMTVVHDKRYSFLLLTQPQRVFWFVFFHLDKPFRWPKRRRYTEDETESLATSVQDHAVSDSVIFGDLWRARDRGSLINIEEGVLEHWFHGRIALAGDAAHKITPNIALGGNSAMESVVVLCNQLQCMLANQPKDKRIDITDLTKCFEFYQEERITRMKTIMSFSSLITSVQAWETPLYKFVANWVLPLQPDRRVANQLGQIIREAPKLDFVSYDGFPQGRITWRDAEPAAKEPRFWSLFLIITLAIPVVAVVYFMGSHHIPISPNVGSKLYLHTME